jgi:hypothetical protein
MMCLIPEYNVKTGNVRSTTLVIAGQGRAPCNDGAEPRNRPRTELE